MEPYNVIADKKSTKPIEKLESLKNDAIDFFKKQVDEEEKLERDSNGENSVNDYYGKMDFNVRNAINLRKEKDNKSDFYYKLQTLNDRISVYKELFLNSEPKILDFKYKINAMKEPNNNPTKKVKSIKKLRMRKRSHSKMMSGPTSHYENIIDQNFKSPFKSSANIQELYMDNNRQGKGIVKPRPMKGMDIHLSSVSLTGKRSASLISPGLSKINNDEVKNNEKLPQENGSFSSPIKLPATDTNNEDNFEAGQDPNNQNFNENPNFLQIESIKEEPKFEDKPNAFSRKNSKKKQQTKEFPFIRKSKTKNKSDNESNIEKDKLLRQKIKNLEKRISKIKGKRKISCQKNKSSRLYRKFSESQKKLEQNKTPSKNLSIDNKSKTANLGTNEPRTTVNKKNKNNSLHLSISPATKRTNIRHKNRPPKYDHNESNTSRAQNRKMYTVQQSYDSGGAMPDIKQPLKSYNQKSMTSSNKANIFKLKRVSKRENSNTKSNIIFNNIAKLKQKSYRKLILHKDMPIGNSKALPSIRSSSQPRITATTDSSEGKTKHPFGFKIARNASSIR
ncbi:unnamed protein product [Moneuplotes crassus]|uniref:Uncharacterized protein n=1 Tax=Euplotes crassus TaxID=5936 RepID=A0AAD1Y8U0_EUPCR|nr:unnamed protein product [Moneuplotes crassus]